MKSLRIISRLGPLALILVLCLVFNTQAQAPEYERKPSLSPLSPGVLMAGAVQAGLVRPVGGAPSKLTVQALACLLPNVQASEGGMPVNETPISVNPTNCLQLLAGANDFNCANLQGFYTSSDGGSTWPRKTRKCMDAVTGTVGLGDPAVGYDRKDTAYIVGLDGLTGNPPFPLVVVFQSSPDNGMSWSSPQIAVHPAISSGMIDKPWLEIDTTAKSPYANALYISATSLSKDRSQSRISVSHSTDGGATWHTTLPDVLQTFPDVDQFSDLAIGKDGTVYVTWMHCFANNRSSDCSDTQARMYFSKSTDGGTTWSVPTVIASPQLAPHTSACGGKRGCFYGGLPNTNEPVINVPAIGVDNSKGTYAGNLYAAMYNWTGSQMKVEVATSSDGGTTWGAPVPVAPSSETHDQFFPWLSVALTGNVGVTWLDRRNDPNNVSYQPFAALSTTGGASFGANSKLSSGTALSNPNSDGFGGLFMGDYTGNTWVGRLLYGSWMDSRNGKNMQDEVGGVLK